MSYGSDTPGGAAEGVGGNDPSAGSGPGGGPVGSETSTTGGVTLSTTIDRSKPDPKNAIETGITGDSILSLQTLDKVANAFKDLLLVPVPGSGIASSIVNAARKNGYDVQDASPQDQEGGDLNYTPYVSRNGSGNWTGNGGTSSYTDTLPGVGNAPVNNENGGGSGANVPGILQGTNAVAPAIGIGTLLLLAAFL